jgi:aldose 1-epimerase
MLYGLLACAAAMAPLNAAGATLERSSYGTLPSGAAVERFTLHSAGGLTLKIVTYGATIVEIDAPDRHSTSANVALGFRDLAGYLKNTPYFGATVGRYANRIARGRFTLEGRSYTLAVNNGPNALHGGLRGFDKVVWRVDRAQTGGPGKPAILSMSYVSPDGDQGYPGQLTTRVTFSLDDRNALKIAYDAATDKTTIVNLTNHSYFNLAGEGSGSVTAQKLMIQANEYTPTDATSIPTGEIASVAGTPMDFRRLTPIGVRLRDDNVQLLYGHGYDFNWVLDRKAGDPPTLAARAYDPGSGRVLDVSTTEPGIQFYSGNFLDGSIVGTGGTTYRQTDGFALETQHFPDSPNHANFPPTVLRPGQHFRSVTIFAFSTDADRAIR